MLILGGTAPPSSDYGGMRPGSLPNRNIPPDATPMKSSTPLR